MNSTRKKKAIIFIDGNNWYHNAKTVIEKPKSIDFLKLTKLIEEKFDLQILKVNYYNSIPDIGLGEENYYKHMVFLTSLKKKGINVKTRKLKKMKSNGKIIRIEKGVDMMIGSDMISESLVEKSCDTCVLITGDSDFYPVMKLIKKAGKEALSASVMKGYSRELLQGEFRFWILKKADLKKCTGS